jgi:hypothetical protein
MRIATSTQITDELLLFRRDVHVGLMRTKVAVALVGKVAQIACERSNFVLMSVCHVLEEFFLGGKSETALGALETTVVILRVHYRVVKLLLALKTHLLDVRDHKVVLLGHVLR